MVGKVPGRLRAEGWVGFNDWVNYDPDPADVALWDTWDCGVGIRCSGVVAIDIDVTNEALAEFIERLVLARLGVSSIRTGNAPKRLIIYATPDGAAPTPKRVLSFLDDKGQKHIVELLGERQQFVAKGVHPKTLKPYTWDQDPCVQGRAGLPVISADDIADVFQEIADSLDMLGCTLLSSAEMHSPDARDFNTIKSEDPLLVHEAVMLIPNTEDTPREFFIKVAHAVKAALVDFPAEGLAIFNEWAEKRPGGQAEGEVERVFDSVSSAGLGIQWVLEQGRKHGMSTLEADFDCDEIVSEAPAKLDSWAPDADAGEEELDSLWNRFVYVNAVKRFVDLRNGAQLDKEQFNDRFRVADNKDKPTDLFLDARRPHSFADVLGYRPGNANKVIACPEKKHVELNVWRPGPYHFIDREVIITNSTIKPWLELSEHLFPDETERNNLLDWMASLLQNPGVKPNWHPLIGSDIHGIGKDSFFAPLIYGLGDNVSVIRTSEFESEWTWWAEGVQLVVVSEISTFERKAVMNKLKSYMATPPETIDINKKGVPQYSVPNVFGLIMFTNTQDGVAIEQHDRRFYVVWSSADKLPEQWYDDYYAWLSGPTGRASVVAHLLQRDLSNFNIRGNAPATEAKESMRKAALSSIEGTIENALEDNAGPFFGDLFTLHDLDLWLRAKGFRTQGPHKMAALLKSRGCEQLGRTRVDAGTGPVGIWACARVAMYKQLRDSKSMAHIKERLLAQRADETGNSALEDFSQTK